MNTVPWHGSEISCGAQSSLSNFLLSPNFCYLTSYLLLSQLYFVTPRTFLQFHICTNASSCLPPFMASLSFSYITAVSMFSKTVTTEVLRMPISRIISCALSLMYHLSHHLSCAVSHVMPHKCFLLFLLFFFTNSICSTVPTFFACLSLALSLVPCSHVRFDFL